MPSIFLMFPLKVDNKNYMQQNTQYSSRTKTTKSQTYRYKTTQKYREVIIFKFYFLLLLLDCCYICCLPCCL